MPISTVIEFLLYTSHYLDACHPIDDAHMSKVLSVVSRGVNYKKRQFWLTLVVAITIVDGTRFWTSYDTIENGVDASTTIT